MTSRCLFSHNTSAVFLSTTLPHATRGDDVTQSLHSLMFLSQRMSVKPLTDDSASGACTCAKTTSPRRMLASERDLSASPTDGRPEIVRNWSYFKVPYVRGPISESVRRGMDHNTSLRMASLLILSSPRTLSTRPRTLEVVKGPVKASLSSEF